VLNTDLSGKAWEYLHYLASQERRAIRKWEKMGTWEKIPFLFSKDDFNEVLKICLQQTPSWQPMK